MDKKSSSGKTILGIDLNLRGIGWTLTKEVKGILKMIRSGFCKRDGAELTNKDRRTFKSQRTQNKRKNSRKKKVLHFCIDQGFLQLSKEGLHKSLQKASSISRSALKEEEDSQVKEFKKFINLDVWRLRVSALEGNKISLQELSRIFYQLSIRRGFPDKNFRSATSGAKFKKGSKKSDALGSEKTLAYLGQQPKYYYAYLANLLPKKGEPYYDLEKRGEHKIRNRYTNRSIYEAEFHYLWEQQAKYHKTLTSKKEKILHHYLFYQLPIKSPKKGDCALEKSRTRALKSSFLFEEFRAYLFANNFVQSIKGSEWDGFLEKRDRVFNVLKKCQDITNKEKCRGITIQELKEEASLGNVYTRYNLTKKVVGMPLTQFFIKIFGEERWYQELSEKERNDIWHLVCQEDTTFEQIEMLAKKYGIKTEELMKFSLPTSSEGVAKYSIKAIRKLLPYIKQGYLEDKAILLAGVPSCFITKEEGKRIDHWKTFSTKKREEIIKKVKNLIFRRPRKLHQEYQEFLLEAYPKQVDFENAYSPHSQDGDSREEITLTNNPEVDSTIATAQRVIKSILKEEQVEKVEQINIEMARKLRQSEEDIKKELQRNRRNANYNDMAILELQKNEIPVTQYNILKFKLWKECKMVCVFTGRPIPKHLLFNTKIDLSRSADMSQVEHIDASHPRDNRIENLTLCYGSKNREKSNRTPFEAFGKSKEWPSIVERATKCFSKRKLAHFLSEEKVEKKLTKGTADLTGYIAKQAAKSMQQQTEKMLFTKGGVVAKLRREWGLNELLAPIMPVAEKVALGFCTVVYIEKPWKKGELLPKREVLFIEHYQPEFEGRNLKQINKDLYEVKRELTAVKKDRVLEKRKKELEKELKDAKKALDKGRKNFQKEIKERAKALKKKQSDILYQEGFVEFCPKQETHSHYIEGKEVPCQKNVKYFFPKERKNRKDERHHIVDSAVISTISHQQNHYYFNLEKVNSQNNKSLSLPYPSFKQDLIEMLNKSLIVHNRKHRGLEQSKSKFVQVAQYPDPRLKSAKKPYQWIKAVQAMTPRGALHEATFFTKNKQLEKFVIRKKATLPLLRNAVDPSLVDQQRIIKIEDSPYLHRENKRGEPVPIKKLRVVEEKSKLLEIRKEIFAASGNNYALVIYQDGSKIKEKVISFFEYINLKRERKRLKDHLKNLKISPVLVLRKGDHFLLDLPLGADINDLKLLSNHLYRMVSISASDYVFVRHLRSLRNQLLNQKKEVRITSPSLFLKRNPKKILLTPLGRIAKITPIHER